MSTQTKGRTIEERADAAADNICDVVSTFVDIQECGSCGGFHAADFAGDCRQDDARFASEIPEQVLRDILQREFADVVESDPRVVELVAAARALLQRLRISHNKAWERDETKHLWAALAKLEK